MSNSGIRRLFRRAVAPDTGIIIENTCFQQIRNDIYLLLKSFLEDIVTASLQREEFKWHKLAEEGGQRILMRAIDCLMAVDIHRRDRKLSSADEAPSLLSLCRSLGHKTLAMQLALGLHIDELAAPHSARQVPWRKDSANQAYF